MAASVYNISKNNIDTSDLRVLLVKSTYSFDADHEDVADVAASECDFTNYARKALSDEAFSVDDANDRGKLDATDPATWEDAGGVSDNTVGGAIVYVHNAADADAVLISYHPIGKATNGGDFSVSFSADGILYTS